MRRVVLFTGLLFFLKEGVFATMSSATTNYWGKGGMFEKFDKSKEVVSKRALTAKHFRNEDGSYTAVIIPAPVHYLNKNNEWCEIDSRIVESKGAYEASLYKFCNETNNFKTYFPANSRSALGLKFTYEDRDLIHWLDVRLSWTDLSNSEHYISNISPVDGKAAENKVIYEDCFNNIDVEYTVTSTGLNRDIILKQAPDFLDKIPDGSYLNIVERIILPDGYYLSVCGERQDNDFSTDRTVEVKNTQDSSVVFIGIPALTEASQDRKAVPGIGRLQFKFIGKNLYCYTQIPVEWLKDKGQKYSVKASATFTPSSNGGTGTGCLYSNETSSCTHSGYYIEVAAPSNSCNGFEARGWVDFNLSSLSGLMSSVSDATLKLYTRQYCDYSSVKVNYYGCFYNNTGTDLCMACMNPSGFWASFVGSHQYTTQTQWSYSATSVSVSLGSTACTDIFNTANNVTSKYFSMGFVNNGSPTTEDIQMYAYNESSPPQLTVTYTPSTTVPTCTTTTASSITSTTASSGGAITDSGGTTITAKGVCWSTSTSFDTTGSHTSDGTGAESFTSSITGLSAGTTYYYKAYAANSVGLSYGSQKSFKTLTSAPSWQSPNHSANETDKITWKWNSVTGATSYKIDTGGTYTDVGDVDSCQEIGLSVNTQYTRHIVGYNGTSWGDTSAPGSAYTSIETPTGITFGTIDTASIKAQSTNTPSNLGNGSSGLIIYNTTNSDSSGWKQNNDWWTSSSLSENTQYTFNARARNGDGDTTGLCASASKYTLCNTPATLDTLWMTGDSVSLYCSRFTNDTEGKSDYFFRLDSGGVIVDSANSPDSAHVFNGLVAGADYIAILYYINGDSVRTEGCDSITFTTVLGLSISVDPIEWNLGTVQPTTDTISVDMVGGSTNGGFKCTNTGGGTITFTLKVANSTTGSPAWTAGTARGVNTFAIWGLFGAENAIDPDKGYFAEGDTLNTGDGVPATATVFGNSVWSGTYYGAGVPASEARALYLKFDAPTTSTETTPSAQNIVVTVGCQAAP